MIKLSNNFQLKNTHSNTMCGLTKKYTLDILLFHRVLILTEILIAVFMYNEIQEKKK